MDASLLNKSDNSSLNSEMIVIMDESKDSETQSHTHTHTQSQSHTQIAVEHIYEKNNNYENNYNKNNENTNNMKKNENGEYVDDISDRILVINPSIENAPNINKNSFLSSPPKKEINTINPTDLLSNQKKNKKNNSLSLLFSNFSNSFYLKEIKVGPDRKEKKGREIKNIVSKELLIAAKIANIEIDDLGKSITFFLFSLISS